MSTEGVEQQLAGEGEPMQEDVPVAMEQHTTTMEEENITVNNIDNKGVEQQIAGEGMSVQVTAPVAMEQHTITMEVENVTVNNTVETDIELQLESMISNLLVSPFHKSTSHLQYPVTQDVQHLAATTQFSNICTNTSSLDATELEHTHGVDPITYTLTVGGVQLYKMCW
jgi:hypothetical protein